jgi:hypothetical protein
MCKDEGVPSVLGEDPTLMVVPEKQLSVEQIAESELNNNPPSVSSNWNEEDIDAPTSEFGNIYLYLYIFWKIAYSYIYFWIYVYTHVCSQLKLIRGKRSQISV